MRRQSSTGRLERRAKNGRAARRRAPRDYVLVLFMLLTPVVLLLLLAPPDEPVAPTWLQSMCRVSYAAEFGRYRMAQCCPHPLVNTKTTTGFNNKRSDGVWRSASLAHLWSRWNAAYFSSSLPRLMVRYEDLLFRGEETTATICECMGGTMTSVFNPIDVGYRIPRASRSQGAARLPSLPPRRL